MWFSCVWRETECVLCAVVLVVAAKIFSCVVYSMWNRLEKQQPTGNAFFHWGLRTLAHHIVAIAILMRCWTLIRVHMIAHFDMRAFMRNACVLLRSFVLSLVASLYLSLSSLSLCSCATKSTHFTYRYLHSSPNSTIIVLALHFYVSKRNPSDSTFFFCGHVEHVH